MNYEKLIDKFINIRCDLEEEKDKFEEKIGDINERADLKCRDLTEKEEERIEELESKISTLDDIIEHLYEIEESLEEFI